MKILPQTELMVFTANSTGPFTADHYYQTYRMAVYLYDAYHGLPSIMLVETGAGKVMGYSGTKKELSTLIGQIKEGLMQEVHRPEAKS